jgi:hypothetical protein
MKTTLLCALLLGSASAYAQQGEAYLMSATDGGHPHLHPATYPVLLDEELPEEALEPDAFELISFQAQPSGTEGVVVQFATLAERPGERFIVERSSDLIDWEVATEVHGAGSPGEYTPYEVVDHSPHTGVSYYRLWRMKEEGAEEISDLYSVRFDAGQGLMIHSDVRPGHFVVRAQGHISEVLLLNNRGQFVPMQMDVQGDRVQVNAEHLAPGVYYVQAVVNGASIMRPVHIGSDSIIGG